MSTKVPQDEKLAQRQAKLEKHDHRVEHIFRRILHFFERVVAVITLIVLIIALGYEVFMLVTNHAYLTDINEFLHNILTIVVGLEFVRMLIDTTPANILEVLSSHSRGIWPRDVLKKVSRGLSRVEAGHPGVRWCLCRC